MLNDILEYNDFQDVNSDLDELSSIHGTANLVLWIDEDGFVRMSPLKPSESFVIYDNSIKQEAVGAVLGFPTRMSMIGCDFRLVFVDLCG